LNPGPTDYDSAALTTELTRHAESPAFCQPGNYLSRKYMALRLAPQQILLSSQSHSCIFATQQFATWRMLDYPSALCWAAKSLFMRKIDPDPIKVFSWTQPTKWHDFSRFRPLACQLGRHCAWLTPARPANLPRISHNHN
jgi:hypothetical protein